jgi:hypothetical protein
MNKSIGKSSSLSIMNAIFKSNANGLHSFSFSADELAV